MSNAWHNDLPLRKRDQRIAYLEQVIVAAFEALESNNEADAFLILKNAQPDCPTAEEEVGQTRLSTLVQKEPVSR